MVYMITPSPLFSIEICINIFFWLHTDGALQLDICHFADDYGCVCVCLVCDSAGHPPPPPSCLCRTTHMTRC